MYTFRLPPNQIPSEEIAFLLQVALWHVPAASKGSFIVSSPYVPAVLANDHIVQTRLVGLLPSQQLVAHTDPPISGIRHHLPLQSNPGCWVFHDGVWQQLEVGRMYTMDPTKPHGAVNWGTELRLHLMIDVLPTRGTGGPCS